MTNQAFFHPLEVVSSYHDPQLQVGVNKVWPLLNRARLRQALHSRAVPTLFPVVFFIFYVFKLCLRVCAYTATAVDRKMKKKCITIVHEMWFAN